MSYENKKIVELFGLPGSGKSFIFNKFSKSVENPKFHKANYKLRIFWIWIIVKESLKIRRPSLIRFKFALLRNLLNKKGILIDGHLYVDEGLLQRILSFYETKIDEREIERIFSHIDIPDKVLIIERKQGITFGRYKNKENTRTKLGQDYLENWKDTVIHNYQLIVKYLKQHSIPYKFASMESEIKELIYE